MSSQNLLIHESHTDRLERELQEMKRELSNVRRGLFARHSELEKKYQETYFELELLKSSIAKQDVKIWTSRSSNFIPTKKNQKETDLSPDLFTCIL